MIDTIQEQWLVQDDERASDMRRLIRTAQSYWENLEGFRERRRRSRNYYRGHQWSDTMEDPDTGEAITEAEYIKKQGKVPTKNNQIRQIIKNLLGQYRENSPDPIAVGRNREDAEAGEIMTNALQHAYDLNMLEELDARSFEEFLMSGFYGQKIGFKWWKERDRDDVKVDQVEPTRFFYNTDARDPRLTDIELCGEIIDASLDDVIATFAHDRSDAERIKDMFREVREETDPSESYGFDMIDNIDFYVPQSWDKVRMYEIWRTERAWVRMAHDPSLGTYEMTDLSDAEIDQLNQQRVQTAAAQGVPADMVPLISVEERFEEVWKVYFLTPMGHILYEGITPFEHQSTPYALMLYPMVDGEVWGLVEDVIDQQRYINRLITLLDFMIGAGAKGVLMVPEDTIPEGWDVDDFADEWSKFNGVIAYKPSRDGKSMPTQITSNSTNVGATQMLQIQMNLMKEISGVTSAIQGHDAPSGTPASLYAQQTVNASISNKDYFESFFFGKKKRDLKIVKVIQQFYEEKRYLNVAGRAYQGSTQPLYDPEKVKTVEYDLVLGQATNTMAFRQMVDEYLFKFLEGGLIDLPMFLEHTSLPFADQLMQSIKSKQEELAEAQGGAGGAANPQAEAMIQQMMAGMGQPQQNALQQAAGQAPLPQGAPMQTQQAG